jgi:hypothetical protein
MTVQVKIPYNSLVADGTNTTFVFTYSLTEEEDLYVLVSGVLQQEFSDYTIEDVTNDGGEIEFAEAPTADAVVLIYRFTTRSQEIDYITGNAFPLESHENGFDKFMRILQELIAGTFTGIDDDGNPFALTFDLSTTTYEFIVTVNNSGGTDADLPMWTSAEFAGVYAATVDLEANIPADEAVSTKPDNYIYIGI